MDNDKDARMPTGEFAMQLIASESFEDFFSENIEQMQPQNLRQYLGELCSSRGISPNKLMQDVDIDRNYGHKILSGNRTPTREYVLRMALGLELTIDECRKLLSISGNSQLYPRIPRDAAILYCLHHKFGYLATQEKLHEWGMTVLSGSHRYQDEHLT